MKNNYITIDNVVYEILVPGQFTDDGRAIIVPVILPKNWVEEIDRWSISI